MDEFNEKYKLLDHIADGRFATVHKCSSIKDDATFAAKIIKKKRVATAKRGASRESIEMEINILSKLSHPNIIKIFGSYERRDNVVLILELVSGGELFEYISNRGILSEDEASKFIHQILLGVKHIHSHNVLHLDLKPENILVENANTQKIKIIDFGLAMHLNDAKPIKAIQGTPAFVAPEIINYDALSFTSDTWSIGIITFTMLHGFNPFEGATDDETMTNIVRCQVNYSDPDCSPISDLAQSFIANLLVKNPKKRLLTEDCLQHRWIKPEEPSNIEIKRRSFVSSESIGRLKSFIVSPKRPCSYINDSSCHINSRFSLQEGCPQFQRSHSNTVTFIDSCQSNCDTCRHSSHHHNNNNNIDHCLNKPPTDY